MSGFLALSFGKQSRQRCSAIKKVNSQQELLFAIPAGLLLLHIRRQSDVHSLDIFEPSTLISFGGQGMSRLQVVVIWVIRTYHAGAHSVTTLPVLGCVHLFRLRVEPCITNMISKYGMSDMRCLKSSAPEVKVYFFGHFIVDVVHPSMPKKQQNLVRMYVHIGKWFCAY